MKSNYFVVGLVIFVLIGLIFLIIATLLFSSISSSETHISETYLFSSTSPNGAHHLEVYKMNSGATVDFSIRVYLIENGNKELIYNAYHEYNAEVLWVDNDTVYINDIKLNISTGETYDWRKIR